MSLLERWMTSREAAEQLGVTRATVHSLVFAGHFETVRVDPIKAGISKSYKHYPAHSATLLRRVDVRSYQMVRDNRRKRRA